MGKYLDKTGLSILWNKIKSVFLQKSGGTITGDLTVQGTGGIDCEYNVQASGFIHNNPTNANDMLLANGNTLPQNTFSLSGHTHPYLPISGGTLTNNLTIQTGGIWVQGGSAAGGDNTRMSLVAGMPDGLEYNNSKRGVRIYSNAIAFADPYNGNSNNDAGWIRHIETTENDGILEIAVGDDGMESIVVRKYNTHSDVVKEAYLLDSSGNTIFPGAVYASGFVKSGSSDSYVLLGGGGHKALSDFSMAHTHPYLPISGGTVTGNIDVDFINASSITADNDIKAKGTITADGAMTCDSLTSSLFVQAGNVGADSIEAPDILATNKLAIGIDSAGYEISYFEPVNTNLLRLNGANLAIGTTSDSRNLSVHGDNIVQGTLYVDNIKGNSENSTNLTLGTGDNTGYIWITDDMFGKNDNGKQSWSIDANSGNATFSGVSQTSDQRLKENIHDVDKSFTEKYWATEHGLIHEYDWIKSKKHATGMIAQELLNYIPEAVNYNVEADSYSVDYTSATCKIMGAMFKKIKSLENEIITMKQEIEKLKK